MRDNRHDPHGHPFGGERTSRRGSNGTNGARPEGLRTHGAALDEVAEPVDLAAVQADDELLNALSSGMTVSAPGLDGYDADDRVAAILAAWKAEVDAEPIPDLVDIDTAVSAVVAARPASRRGRHLAPVAAAAAFIVLCVGGVSVGSYSAQPDDVLWGVSKVLYSERAESMEAVARVEVSIARAKQALVAGEPAAAAQELAKAQADLAVVRPEEGLAQLAEVQDFLLRKAQETPQGTPADLSAPLATEPTRPVPPGVVAEDPTTPRPAPVVTSAAPVLPIAPQGPTDPARVAEEEGAPDTAAPEVSRLPTLRPDPADEESPVTATEEPGTSAPPDEADDPTVPPGQIQGQTPVGPVVPEGSAGATAAGSGTPGSTPTS